jgi:hypothetical protein
MLTLGGGRQRILDEFRALATAAGLQLRSATRLESGTDVLVLA